MRTLVTTIVIVGLALTPATRAQESDLLRTMQEEMARAVAGLRLKDQPPPYYIAYAIEDATTTRVSGTLGAIVSDQTFRMRMLRVEVRVGDYDFDSSRFISFERDPGISSMIGMGVMSAPLDDDYDAIRRQLWLTTDAAYKRAVNVFARKKAAFQNRVTTDPVPDFSRETPQQRMLPVALASQSVPAEQWRQLVSNLSRAFVSTADIYSSNVSLAVVQGSRHFLNSEGFKTVVPVQSAALRIVAETQGPDGMPLRDFVAEYATTPDKLPPQADLISRARGLAVGLAELRKAPVGDDYTGPVMLEGQAASELVAQTFVPLFLSVRLPDADNPQMQMGGPAGRMQPTPFLTRVGSKVLPDGVTVSDTPTLTRYADRDVPGAYVADDEGMAAQDVILCENGTLRALLTSRTPQKGFLKSNGHARGGTSQAGVFQMRAAAAVPVAQLKTKYLERLKQEGRPFGYIIRTLANPAVLQGLDADGGPAMMAMMMGGPGARQGGPQVIRAVKVTPEGTEEVVRGLKIGDVSHSTFKAIVDASEERVLYNYRPSPSDGMRFGFAPPMGPATADVIVSLISPSLVFSELEVVQSRDTHQKPPIVPPPVQ